jgi:cell shape-determining protein MreC
MWTTVLNIVWVIIKWTMTRSEKSDKAQQSLMELVRRMDQQAQKHASLRKEYEELKASLVKKEEKLDGEG